MAFSPTELDSKFAASASDDNTIKIWDVKSQKCMQTLCGHTDMIWSLTFSHDGSTLCSASDDGTVRMWDVNIAMSAAKRTLDDHGVATFSRHLTLRGHTGKVWGVTYAHAGELIATGSAEGKEVKIWDAATGMCVQTLEGHTEPVRTVTFWRNHLVASTSYDGTIRLWDIKTKECIMTIVNASNSIYSAVFSPDGRYIATSSEQICVWKVATGQLLLTMGTSTPTYELAYARDGKWLASVSADGIPRLWEVESGRCEREFGRQKGGSCRWRCRITASCSRRDLLRA